MYCRARCPPCLSSLADFCRPLSWLYSSGSIEQTECRSFFLSRLRSLSLFLDNKEVIMGPICREERNLWFCFSQEVDISVQTSSRVLPTYRRRIWRMSSCYWLAPLLGPPCPYHDPSLCLCHDHDHDLCLCPYGQVWAGRGRGADRRWNWRSSRNWQTSCLQIL